MKGGEVEQGRYTVAIVRGEGLVGRFGNVLIYIADVSASAAPLISAAESVADMEFPGTAVAGELASVAFQPETAQAFGVVAPTADGLLVLLRGGVTAEINGADGTHELSGVRALTWVDEVVPTTNEINAVSVGAGSGLAGSSQTNLRDGIVLGGGFVRTHAVLIQDQPSKREVIVPHTMVRMEQTQGAAAPAETAAAQAVRARPTLSGTSTFASADAVLVTEEGAAFPLDRAYVIGRDPLTAEAVRNAQASPIVVHEDRHISRVHAFISVEGDAVFVRDNATPGGTYIALPGAKDWTQIGTTPTKLEPGWSVMVGEQILTYRVES